MTKRVRDRSAMIRGMSPRLVEGRYVFRTLTDPDDRTLAVALGTFREDEGLSVIVPAGPDSPMAMRQITCDVPSALDGIGLTAAISTALAEAGIPANVVAAHHHDHVFVPEAEAGRAIDVLTARAAIET